MSNVAQVEEEEAAAMAAYHLRGSHVVGMITKAAIELRLFDVLAAAGPDAELTAGEIAGKLHLKRSNEKGASMLDLMLGFLAVHSILTCTSTAAGGDRRKTYGLTPTGRLMAKCEDAESLAPILLLNFHEDIIDGWHCLKEAVTEGVNPFRKAHDDQSLYEYLEKKPELGKLFNQAMENQSNLVMKNITKKYRDAFMEIKEVLVDVGGGTGATLSTIVSNFPHIKGINFDLPHVISQAPVISGVEHIGGDMFHMIPSGGTILLKWILHNWDDEQCLAILKNCRTALPPSGKVIVVEYILPEISNANLDAREAYAMSMTMMILFDGAKERTEKEFRSLAEKACFSEFKISCSFLNYNVMELVK